MKATPETKNLTSKDLFIVVSEGHVTVIKKPDVIMTCSLPDPRLIFGIKLIQPVMIGQWFFEIVLYKGELGLWRDIMVVFKYRELKVAHLIDKSVKDKK